MLVEVDKGWAWAVCASVAILGIITDGTLKLQGFLFVEYLDLFDQGTTATSWIAFAHGTTSLVMAPVGGYLADKLSHKEMRILLVVLYATSAVCVALAGYMPTLPLTVCLFAMLGLCLGLEDPLSLCLISRYFIKLQTLAYCIACIGGPLGTIIFPLMFTGASHYCGFRGTMLVFSAVWLHALFVPVVAWPLTKRYTVAEKVIDSNEKRKIRNGHRSNTTVLEIDVNDPKATQHESEQQKEDETTSSRPTLVGIQEKLTPQLARMVSRESAMYSCGNERGSSSKNCFRDFFQSHVKFFANPKVALLVLSCFLGVFGFVGAFFLIPPLARENGLSKLQTSVIFTAASVCEILSKVLSGFLVDKCHVSKSVILVTSYVVTGAVGFVVSFVRSPVGLYVYGIALGAFGGIVIGLIVPLLNDIVDDAQKGTAAAMFPLLAGLSGALGPIVLSTIQKSSGSFRHALRFLSAAYLLGIIVFTANIMVCKLNRLCRKTDKGLFQGIKGLAK